MGKYFNCGKVGHQMLECKNETAKKSQQREDRNDDEDFGPTTHEASRKEKNQVKFIDTPEIILKQGQLCLLMGASTIHSM